MKGKGVGDLPSNRVNALIIDKDNEIWIGTDEGLAVFLILKEPLILKKTPKE